MPLYEFQCRKCGRIEEFLLGYGEQPEEACPDCKGDWEKLWSASAPVSGEAAGCEFGGCTPDGPG